MKIFQLIYTSCQKGLSPGAGFQTFSMSEGITPEEKREIERFGLYVPPTDLPTQPTEAEIAAKFPVGFRFFRLESGRYAISQARCVGRDYSGRFGNYFSHTLVLEEGIFPGYPIQWHNSPLFRTSLSDAEANLKTTPPPLPALEMTELEAGKTMQLEDIASFIEQQGMEALKQMLSAVFNHHEDHRRLVLCAQHHHTAKWIAALQMAFPVQLAHQLTFSTYSHDPAAMNIMISGVPKTGSRFAFSQMQKDYEYYIFDFDQSQDALNENTSSEMAAREYEYIKNVEFGYTLSLESLSKYHDFVARFQPPGINRDLDHIDTLYHMSETGIEGLPGDRILEALEFANREASPEILRQLADAMGQLISNLSANADFKTADTVARFLFKTARQSGDANHLEAAYAFFFQALDHLVMSPPQPDLQTVITLYAAIMEENKKHIGEFAAKALDPKRIEQLKSNLSKNPHPGRIETYFHLLLNTVLAINYTWDRISHERKGFLPYTRFSMSHIIAEPRRLNRLFDTVVQEKEFFAQLLIFCLQQRLAPRTRESALLESFIAVLKNKPSQIPTFVRMKLVEAGQQEFVYDEYLTLLKGPQKRQEFFIRYAKAVFLKNPRFLKSHFSRAVNDYLDYLPGQDIFAACSDIISYGDVIEDKNVMKRVIGEFEKGLSLGEPKEKERQKIYDCDSIKKERKITTTPDITGLILLAIEAMKAYSSQGQSTLTISNLDKNPSPLYSLETLTLNRVQNYFSWVFPFMVRLAGTAKEHNLLFNWFANSKLDKTWVLTYPKELKQVIRENKEHGMEMLQEFLKFYLKQLHKEPDYKTVREQMREQLVKILYKLSQSQLQCLRDTITRSAAADKPADRKEWTLLLEMVEEKSRTSGFNIFKRLFGKKKPVVTSGKKAKGVKKPGLQKL